MSMGTVVKLEAPAAKPARSRAATRKLRRRAAAAVGVESVMFGGDRGEGMAVNLPQINCPARAAAWAVHVEPRRPCDQRGPDGRRPQHVATAGQLLVPATDDGLGRRARGGIGNLPLVLPPPRACSPHAAVDHHGCAFLSPSRRVLTSTVVFF
jgi:hypothetical protein